MKENKAVDRILNILEFISKYPNGTTLAEIYRNLSLPKSTTYDILQALYKADAIYYKDELLKTYVIGSKMFAIGSVYIENSNLITIAKPLLQKFSNEYMLTTFISKKVGDKIISILKYEPTKAKITTVSEGTVVSKMHSTAIGKAFLAFDDFPLPSKLNKYTDNTIVDIKQLKEELASVKYNGYSIEDKETEDYIRGIAIPVYNFESRVVGTISAYGLYTEFEDIKNLVNELKDIAKEVSIKLGYKGN